jgi:hypothetical protein
VSNTTLRAVADAYVRGGVYAGKNFGSSAELDVKKHASADFNRVAYLRFDISTVGAISSAKVRLWGKLSSAESRNLAVEVAAVSNTTWGEGTINYNNKPAPA